MGQRQFDGFHVVDQHLFQGAYALFLNDPQRQLLQLALQGDSQVFEGMVRRVVGEGKPPDVQQRVQHRAQGDGGDAHDDIARGDGLVHQQRPDDLVEKPKGQHLGHHAQHHPDDGGIGGFTVLPGVAQDPSEQNEPLLNRCWRWLDEANLKTKEKPVAVGCFLCVSKS